MLKSTLMTTALHFEVGAEEMARACNFAYAVAKAAGGDSLSNPDHRSILLSATPQGVVVRCTTAEYQASTLIASAKVFAGGDCMSDAKRLSAIVDAQPMGSVLTFNYDNSNIIIESSETSGVRSMESMVPDYAMPEWRLDPGHSTTTVTLEFADDLKYAEKFSCDDYTKSFYGINLDETGILAFNSFEFVKIKKSWSGMPSTTLDPAVSKFLAAPKDFGDGDITISSDGNKFKVSFGESSLTGPTIANDFETAREKIEALIEPYLESDSERIIECDYKSFGQLLRRLEASADNPLDKVLLMPNGLFSVGFDRSDNYSESLTLTKSTMENPSAISLEALKKLYKESQEGKDEGLMRFIYHPTHERPEHCQIVVVNQNKTIGFSPSVLDQDKVNSAVDAREILDSSPNSSEAESDNPELEEDWDFSDIESDGEDW